jgi:hypothetical protein
MAMPVAFGQQGAKFGHIQPVVAGGVELDSVAADLQKGRLGAVVAGSPAQSGERGAQTVPGGSFRLVRPQQSGQRLPPVRSIGFDRQVGQQGPDLVIRKSRRCFPVQRYLKRAQEVDSQPDQRFTAPSDGMAMVLVINYIKYSYFIRLYKSRRRLFAFC